MGTLKNYIVVHKFNNKVIGGRYDFGNDLKSANEFVDKIMNECEHLEGRHQISLLEEFSDKLIRIEYFSVKGGRKD